MSSGAGPAAGARSDQRRQGGLMKSRWMWVGIAAIVIVLVGGGVYYTRSQPSSQPQSQRARDPGFGLILSIRTLESTPETQLTKEQIAGILPFVKALKDIPTSDAEAITVIVRAVSDTFTPAQKAALEEARKRFQERQRSQGAQVGGPPGAGAAPGTGGAPGSGGEGVGPGGPSGGRVGSGGALSDEQRAQLRTRTFERMIRYLERRMK